MKILGFQIANKTRIKISFLGIKISLRSPLTYFYFNKIYQRKNNKLKRIYFLPNINIKFNGINSTVILENPKAFENTRFILNNNSFIEIKNTPDNAIKDLFIEIGDHSKIYIDENFSTIGTKIYNAEPHKTVSIGKNCMFSENTLIRTNDGHTIYSLKDLKPINFPLNVILEDHIWVSKNVTILKGVKLNKDTVIAANSVVTKSCPESNVVLAGNPANIVRREIGWDKRNVFHYSMRKGFKYA